MQRRLSLNWSALAIRGIAAIAFAIIAFLLPGLTLGALILLFAAYAIVDGASHLVTAFRHREAGGPDWLMVVGGIAGIAAGILAVLLPGITALFLVTLIGAWAIITGAMEVIAAYQLRKEIRGEWLLAFDGVISVLFGIYLWLFPGAGAIALVWLIAAFALISGVSLLVLAFRMRSMTERNRDVRGGSATAA
ncbi:MAG TPA: DUF308 domain-containing protein [Candidatus Limnocylindrales bacterium]|jgi:uncharacterized membrane protein HdeD (DUF308 family)|nr:DUF308 domain-containing protein [Candidatus Limnocylindrales bacterium]